MQTQYCHGHQKPSSNHTRESKILLPEWPTRNQEEMMYTCAYNNCIGCPVKYRIMFKLLTVAYNTVHGMAPHYLKEQLKRKEYHRTTRQPSSIGITLDVLLNKKKSFADRGFSYAAAKYWNDIPDNIKTAKDIKNFKSLLETHFFKKAFQQ